MQKQYRYTWLRRLGNGLLAPALRLGIGPSNTRLLTVTGRKTGQAHTTPVNLVIRDGAEYLVSPYGERAWVKNARTAGEITLSRGRGRQQRRIRELPPSEAAPVLRDYRRQNPITGSFFSARPGAPEQAFEAEAERHPVFRLE